MTISEEDVQVPGRMKAAVLDRFGGPETMRVATIPVPPLSDDEVLIRVGVAGVGVWDYEVGEGSLGGEGTVFPLVLGSDGAGVVVARGSEAQRFRVGDQVYAWGFMNPKGGFFAEYAAISEAEVEPIPRGMSVDEAGVLAVDGLTALAGIEELQLAPTQSLMILGASGGVGHLALQLAVRLGVRVLAVASGEDGLELVRRLGADSAVDGRTADIPAVAHAFAPEGLDAALVLASGDFSASLALVRSGGRIAYPNGVQPPPEDLPGVHVKSFNGYGGREALDRLNQMIGMGPFHVEISREYPLEQASQALQDAAGHHLGKLAVVVSAG
jgi:NADPH2:quinone reductase